VLWPARNNETQDETRFFANGRFFTPDRKARLIAPQKPALYAAVSDQFPFRLNTGRVRDQWHTMARSGLSPRLAHHAPEPFVELHPDDAAAAGLRHDGFARLRSRYGSCVLKVVVTDGQRRGSLFVPMHWSDVTASSARVGELVTPATDPYSGQPEAKATPVAIEPVAFAYCGFALARTPLALPAETWWARVTVTNGVGLLLASNDDPAAWRMRAAALFGAAELAEYLDEPRGIYRAAAFDEGRLIGCLFVGMAEAAPQWDTVKALFESEALGEMQRRAVLSGKSTDGVADPGPVICACFGVGLNVIRAALATGAAASVDDIGRALRAGTNCGSCLPELKRIVNHERVAQTA
jgi:assimilatory nitrate reductase catalytic subunit